LKKDNIVKGNRGEKEAEKYLVKNGYKIIFRKYRAYRGEIDLIALKNRVLVFAEVKSSSSTLFGEPENRVSIKKQRQIAKVADFFIRNTDLDFDECRFDVISVMLGSNVSVKHIEDAFYITRRV